MENNVKTKKIILCRGIQGSGKTSYADAWVLEDPEHRVRFNNDNIRYMLGGEDKKGYWITSRESLVTELKITFLINAMKKGYDIIVDNMNLNLKEIKFFNLYMEGHNKLIKHLELEGKLDVKKDFYYELEFKDFFIPVDECIRRDAMRPNPIGEKVIRDTWNYYKQFIQTESVNKYVKTLLKQDSNKKAIVLDMDSTLCFNTTGRPWYGEGAAEGILTDIPNIPIVNLARTYFDSDYYVIIITGRDVSLAKTTEQWLKNNDVPYYEVLYRNKNDFRKSADIKKEIITDLLKDYNIELIIDDAEPVVEMYREMGLTVLQPNKTI